MIPHPVIAFFSLIGLLILHELGHFILAKRFGVRVEEFGIGYPPRLIGKKFGETIYSLNLLPFGAFVRLPGEIEKTDDPRSFSQQSVKKRILITLGGVFSFWVIAGIIFSVVFFIGAPVAVEDNDVVPASEPNVRIAGVSTASPAEKAGLKAGDIIKKMSSLEESLTPSKIEDVQAFTQRHLGRRISLKVQRGDRFLEISLIPRISPPKGEGAMGVALVRTAVKKYPWYLAPWQGLVAAGRYTLAIAQGYFQALQRVFQGEPSGVQVTGPIGVFQIMLQAQELGTIYFLNFLALISLHLAIFNILPIPAVDGGKFLFLCIEGLRKKPIPAKIEQKITAFSFLILLGLMLWVTVQDIYRLF